MDLISRLPRNEESSWRLVENNQHIIITVLEKDSQDYYYIKRQ